MYLICGEALFDFFFEGERGPGAVSIDARAGGSPFNVAIGIARLGGKSALLTGLSTDLMGDRLGQVLADEGVDGSYLVRTDRPTTLSLVGVGSDGGPAYQFYGAGSADTGLGPEDVPALRDNVYGVHFGSYSIAVAPVADAFATLAAQAGRFVSLDPNVRPTIEPEMAVWRARVGALLPYTTVVKISAEDLETLHPGEGHGDVANRWLALGPRLVIVTDGGAEAKGWLSNGEMVAVTPPGTKVVDTVGAGDTFQAALLARLAANGDPAGSVDALDAETLAGHLDYAARAAAITVSRRGADLPRAAELTG